MPEPIAFAWSVFWVLAPFVLGPVGLIWAGRWLMRRTSGDGFAYDFIPAAADVDDRIELVTDRTP